MHAMLETLTDHAGRLHSRQRGWAGWQRLCWWLLLLPVALACWASLQTSVAKQRVGWGLTAASLVLLGSAAVGGADQGVPATAAGAGKADASVQSTPVVTPVPLVAAPVQVAPASTPSPVVTAVPPAAQALSLAAAPVAPRKATPSAVVSVRPVVTASPRAVASSPQPKPVATSARPVVSAVPVAVAEEFDNCADMRRTYPHGVGRPGAQDSTSGTPVTTFKVSSALYEANTKSDRDGDGIACEQL